MAEPFDPVQSANESARETTRQLLREARFGTLATINENGYPFASLVTFALDRAQTPFLLVSRLSGHTKHLLADPRCSLLVGEPGKGDPLARSDRLSREQIHRGDASAVPAEIDDTEGRTQRTALRDLRGVKAQCAAG